MFSERLCLTHSFYFPLSLVFVVPARVRNADSRYSRREPSSIVYHHHHVTQGWVGDLGCGTESIRWTGIRESSRFFLSVSLLLPHTCWRSRWSRGLVLTAYCRFVQNTHEHGVDLCDLGRARGSRSAFHRSHQSRSVSSCCVCCQISVCGSRGIYFFFTGISSVGSRTFCSLIMTLPWEILSRRYFTSEGTRWCESSVSPQWTWDPTLATQ